MERQDITPTNTGYPEEPAQNGPPKKRGKPRSRRRISSGEEETDNGGTPTGILQRPNVCGELEFKGTKLAFNDIQCTPIVELGEEVTSSGTGLSRTGTSRQSSEFITMEEVLAATHQRVKTTSGSIPKPFECQQGPSGRQQEETPVIQSTQQKRPQAELESSQRSAEANSYRNFKGVSGAVIDTSSDNIENAIDLDMLIAGDLEFDNEVSITFLPLPRLEQCSKRSKY